MRSLPAFVMSTAGIAVIWALSGVVPFVVLTLPDVEGILKPSASQYALLACCYAGGALLWSLISAEIAALTTRRVAAGWTAVLTALLTMTYPVLGNSMYMLMVIVAGMGCFSGMFWTVWFPIVLDVDYRVRPGAVAACLVLHFTAAAVLTPVAVELIPHLGSLRGLGGLGGLAFVAAVVIVAASKKILRPSRQMASVSFFRLGRDDISALANLSFVFLFIFCLPTLVFAMQTLSQSFLMAGFAETFRLEQSALAWIGSIGWVPVIVMLLVAMPMVRHGVPLRYFGLGLTVAGGGMLLFANAPNQVIFVAGYLGAFVGIGLCWGSYYACVSSAVHRSSRLAALIVSGFALILGLALAGGFQWGALALNLGPKFTFMIAAAVCGGCGLLALFASLFAVLNGAHQGGHFDDESHGQTVNFKKFTYGNPST